MKVTHERLKDLLSFDPDTGQFIWKQHRQRVRSGATAGAVRKTGYRFIVVDGSAYAAHRLAWFYVYGVWPKALIDHIDSDKLNNRVENLREVSHAENMQNQPKPRKANRTGFAGVRPHCKRFQADVRVNGKRLVLGTFDTAEEAYEACMRAKESAGVPTNYYKKELKCA